MFENIRRLIMYRLQEKIEWIPKIKGNICPRIYDEVEVIKSKIVLTWKQAHPADEGIWEQAHPK